MDSACLPGGMSANCSNTSLLPSSLGYLENIYKVLQECFRSADGKFSLAAYIIATMVVLLPIYNYTLYLGFQRWRRQQPATLISHSDAFTYHMIVIEQLSFVGSVLLWFGVYSADLKIMYFSLQLTILNISGENAFHLMTCLERYLAVLYPIAYLSLRKEKGIKIRNVAIGCAWLLSFVCVGVLYLETPYIGTFLYTSITTLTLVVMSFCSVNVLYVLIRPQPVERSGHRQAKLGAFYTITLIMVALSLRGAGFVVTSFLFMFHHIGETKSCILLMTVFWASLPSNLVLPLLYLHRAGRLPGFTCKTESG